MGGRGRGRERGGEGERERDGERESERESGRGRARERARKGDRESEREGGAGAIAPANSENSKTVALATRRLEVWYLPFPALPQTPSQPPWDVDDPWNV